MVLVVFSRAPLGHALPSDFDGCGGFGCFCEFLVVFGGFACLWSGVLGHALPFSFCFRQAPRGSLGYPLSFPLTSIRFPPLLVLVVFGCGFWFFWWFGWFWVVTPYRQIVLVARGCDGFVLLFVVFGGFACFWGGPPGPLPPSL